MRFPFALSLALPCAFFFLACGETPATGDRAAIEEAPAASEPAANVKERKPKRPAEKNPARLAPRPASAPAPETFRVLLRTTKGEIEIECVRAWSPFGVDRFHQLVGMGFYSDAPFYAVAEDRYAMFGLPLNPKLGLAWRSATIPDEPAVESNRRGTLAFGRPAGKPNSRSTELIVNLADNPAFDALTAPIGRVVRGLEVADALFSGYAGTLDMQALRSKGKAYLSGFPELDRIEEALFVE